ncbi:MAG: ABC transporter ATP-binding protein [Planctomycetota bacterium]|nr:ABC transporter ATP-binding protein [Planctomycetota bacterium]
MDSSKNLESPKNAEAISDRDLIYRMLAFALQYRRQCVILLVLQTALMVTAILAVQLGGFALDWVQFRLTNRDIVANSLETPPVIYGWSPPLTWSGGLQMFSLGLILLAIGLIRAFLNFAYAIENGRLINLKMVVDLRIAVYDKMQQLSFRFFDANASSTLINRLTGDIHATRSFVDGVVIQLTILVLSLVSYFVAMLRIHVGLTIACLATTPLLWWITNLFSKRIRPEYDKNRELFDAMTLVVAENAEGQQTVKAFGRQQAEIEKYRNASMNVQQQQRSIFWQVSVYTPTVQFLTQINLVILLGYGGFLVTQGQLAIGSGIVVFAGLLQQFSSQITALSGITNTIQQSLTGARRVFEILDSPVEIVSPKKDAHLPNKVTGEIAFRNVSFGYHEDNLTLQGIDLFIAAGETVAILGPVGAGKTTLLSLIPRFYDPTSGTIELDGVNLKKWDLPKLRRSIGIVFQETFLFSNTIAANIAFGSPTASIEQIVQAAKTACADEFIRELPQGYETVLGEFGLTLSGGQRQRLAIARALVLDPPILLLDDPTASIDPETEHEILEAMKKSLSGRTSFIIAHRLATLQQADRVIVIEGGQIVQQGTHRSLIEIPGLYRDVAVSQGITMMLGR